MCLILPVLVVIGIGGSYLGARAVIEGLSHSFYNSMPDSKRKTPQIVYAGCNLSPVYLNDLLDFARTILNLKRI